MGVEKTTYLKLDDLHSSPNISRMIKSGKMRWVVDVACIGDRRGAYMVLVGKREGKRQLGRPGRRWQEKYSDFD
jgi:S-ribosylhomocysteine lyase LuxS involved in autoinducer biosynthesis